VPDVSYGSQNTESFLGIPEILRELNIPSVSLINSFNGLGDLSPYRVADVDRHPNREGHKRLFDELYRQLQADPLLMATLLGAPANASH